MRLPVKEPFSCYSHLFGVLLAVPGLIWLVAHSHGDPWRIAGFSVYGSSLVLLYSASAIYHWLPLSPRYEDLLQRFDHVAIYVLIAGTYTPVCLVTLRGPWGWSLFGIVWAAALLGATIKLFFNHLPRWTSTLLYLAMGWTAIVAVVPLVRALPVGGLAALLAGGLFYTAGAIIYGAERPDPMPDVLGFHGVFHLFVLAGSVSHFLFMLGYVLPAA